MASVSEIASRDFDQQRYVDPPRIYVIASQPRSGSHHLAELLRTTGSAGVPLEYFHTAHWKQWTKRTGQNNPISGFKILCQLRTTTNGVFGFKAHWKQMQYALRLRLEVDLKDAAFVEITRNDLLGQAISLVFAGQTGAWISEHKTKRQAEYSFPAIQSALNHLLKERSQWDLFFALTDIEPLRISYEDLVDNRDSTMNRVCTHIGATWTPVDSVEISVQRTAQSDEWRERFLATLPELHEPDQFWRGRFGQLDNDSVI